MSRSGETYDDFAKYSYFPIKYQVLEDYVKKQQAVLWTLEEIEFKGDRRDWDKLDSATTEFVKFILLFFAQADGIVNENLSDNFKRETSKYKEARHFYATQEFIETVHNETYSNFIEVFIRDEDEKRRAFNAIKYYPSIQRIAEWAFTWMDREKPLPERVIGFACLEGIMFSSAFAAIYWLKRKNILKGLAKANEFIARDEALHTEFAVALYHVMTGMDEEYEPLSEERVHEIISQAVGVAEQFTRDSLKVDLVGMNADDMVDYIKCTADSLVVSLGYNKIYNAENPFDWMAIISLPNKSNFFETRVSEYGRQTKSSFTFDLDAAF